MKIIATCMVANEADVIEAFVRHNVQWLDAIVVLNHASVDRTPEILAELAREGLPLVLLNDRDRAFRQGERQTYLAKRFLAEANADFCFVLDADELIRIASRAELEAALAALPAGACGLVPMHNYYGLGADSANRNPVLRLTRRMANERHGARKVVLRRGFEADERTAVSLGNHAAVRIVEGRVEALPHSLLAGVSLAHFPVRSPEQIAKKALIGWLAHRLTQPERFSGDLDARNVPAWHWREIFRRIAAGEAVGEELMREAIAIAAGGETTAPVRDDELVEDPVPAPYALRYTDESAAAPLATLAAWSEALVADINAAASARG